MNEELLKELDSRISQSQFRKYRPYGHPETLCPDGKQWKKMHEKAGWMEWSNKPWQLEFHNTACKEKANICANGTGKSMAMAWELAAHLMGDYPDWFEGYRYERPILAWVGSIDAGLQVEGIQKILLGNDLGYNYGTGLIPRDRLVGKPQLRQSGIPGTAHQVNVRSKHGVSQLILKSYAQGWQSWQTAAPDIVALDEQPDDNDNAQRPIFEECQTRLVRTSGLLLAGFTPLLGETDLTRHFMYPENEKWTFCSGATWDDVPHLKEEDKEKLRKTYPNNSVQTRTMGLPMMGEGRVFEFNEDDIKIPRPDIPRHYARICGIDFGVGAGHPTAAAWLAHDRDRDIIVLYDEYRKESQDSVYHAEAIKRRGNWIPVAWPHDGHKTSDLTKSKADGKEIKDKYMDHGLNMLPISARYDRKIGGAQSQEPIIQEINERAMTGRFLVCDDLFYFFEESRSFHRKDGKIVNRREDVIKAVMYALMMIRHATPSQAKIPMNQHNFRGLRV